MKVKKIAIIVLHYGDKKITQQCLESLSKYENYPYTIILVNNTQEILKGKYFKRKNIVVINNKKNLGFAKGVNVGLSYGLKKHFNFFLLLNNDTKINSPLLEKLLSNFNENEKLGIVAPVITFTKNKKRLFDLGGNYNRFFGRTSHTEVTRLKQKTLCYPDYVSGCCMLIKKEVLEEIGTFDSDFFLYYEDVDFCLRAKGKRYTIAVDPSVVIFHALSKSAGKSSALAVYHQTRSAVVFGHKHMQKWYQKVFHICFLSVQIALFGKNSLTNLFSCFRALWSIEKTNALCKNIFYVLLYAFLGLFSFWKIFSFGFWKDDWSLYWATLYDVTQYHGYFNHPGTPIEFFLLSRILGLHFFWWQLLGFVLHSIGAYLVYQFIKTLTHSQKAGVLSGMFFAVSYAGLESIYYPSVHVTILALLPLLIACQKFVQSLVSKKYLKWFFFWLVLAIVIDPPRIVPIIFLLPLFLFFQKKTKSQSEIIKWLKRFFIGFAFLGVPLFIIWFVFLSPGTQLAIGIQQTIKDPSFLIRKIHVWWNLLASIGNLCIGLLYPMAQDDQNTGIYSKVFAIVGGFIFLFGIGNLLWFVKTKSKRAGYYTLFTFWMFLFYLPNWFSEPRAPMAAPHRYLLIPSVGFLSILAITLDEISWQPIIFFLTAFIIFLNIVRANVVFSYQASYRVASVTLPLWRQIDQQVAKDTDEKIFMFYGKEPWLSQSILLSGGAPLAILRGNITSYGMPMVTTNEKAIVQFLCKENVPQVNRWNIVLQRQRVTLHNVYAWNIIDAHTLINISSEKRKELLGKARIENCEPLK